MKYLVRTSKAIYLKKLNLNKPKYLNSNVK